MLPPLSILKKQFDYVSDIFDGRPWTKHESIPVDEPTASVSQMEMFHFDRSITSEEVIKEKSETHRPATHEELYVYAKENPDAGKEFWIVALGSFAMYGGDRYVAVLGAGDGGRIFSNYWFVSVWDADDRFLFVRKSSLDTQTLGTSGPLVLLVPWFLKPWKKKNCGVQ